MGQKETETKNPVKELTTEDLKKTLEKERELARKTEGELDRAIFECPICYDEMKEDLKVPNPSCGHKFHRNCIDKWIETALRNGDEATCPLCRGPIDQPT